MFHKDLGTEDIHIPFRWLWINQTSRLGQAVIADDIGKLGLQQDTGKLYVLSDITPTWSSVGGSANLIRSVTHGDTNWYEIYTGEHLTIPTNTAWTFVALISGIDSTSGNTFAFKIEGLIKNIAGTVTLPGSTVTTIYDTDDPSFDARATADDTNNALLVEVSDSDGAGATVNWTAAVTIAETNY